MRLLLVLLSTFPPLASQVIYVWSIHKGHANPPFSTRFALTVALLLNVWSIYRAQGSLTAELFAGIALAQAIITAGQSFRRSKHKFRMGLFDASCVGVSIAGALAWYIVHDPVAGVIAATVADFVAYLPYFRKTWLDPEPKAWPSFALSGLGAGAGLIAYPLTITSTYQCYILVADLLFLVLNFRKAQQTAKPEQTPTLAGTTE